MERKWWHGKVAYQIYPKSFCDANGDGIGDLRGIIGKLDYLKELGVDIIWLSPIYPSPMADQGYDIADYYNIDPRFGTMADFDELLAETKKRDMYLVMDLVVNHCSDEHEWFQKACADPDGKYGKYFYIQDHKEGDPLPCNWRSYFGGPCWDKLPGRDDKIYLHVFHKKQPDLNWENPELRQEVYQMVNWWLDKGVAGFRIDAIINIKKCLPFRDYPADRDDGLSNIGNMLEEATGIMDFLQEMADHTFIPHNAFSIGELFNEKEEELPLFIGDGGCFSSIFDFAPTVVSRGPKGWYAEPDVTPRQYRDACFSTQRKAEGVGYVANIIENHDEPRGVSHFLPPEGRCEAGKKMLGGLSFLLKGLPFLFQGQELGMENTVFHDISEIDDCNTLDEYQVALAAGLTPEQALQSVNRLSRDNARTPVQWDASPNAGFTTGTPWLAVNPNYTWLNLAEQRGRPDSIYEFYRLLITLRKDPAYAETLVYGKTEPYLTERDNLMAYFRQGDKTILVAGNFQAGPQDLPLPGEIKTLLLNNLNELDLDGSAVRLSGWQLIALELA